MTVIDLGAWPEREDGLEWCRIWAVMLFPDDRERRSDFLDMGRRLAPVPEGYFYRPGRPQPRGTRAGEVLSYVYRMAKFHPERQPSLGKAFYLIDKTVHAGEGARTLDGTRVRAAAAHVRKSCWGEYRSVAHLWAAWRMFLDYASAADGHNDRVVQILWSLLVEKFDDFLTLSELLRGFGETFSSYPRKTLLPPGRTWRAPAGVELLKKEHVAFPLHRSELELLDRYEAKKR